MTGWTPAKVRHQAYLASPEWRELRAAALARDGYRCRLCSRRGPLHVHHRWYPRPWRADSLEALTVLCRFCHLAHHHRSWWLALVNRVLLIAVLAAVVVFLGRQACY